ncbi:inositol transporter-like SP family MFS transporter [Kineococcus xinjiangensis]|uniref:Inositol transporter-like SP family MFS transporter n=1 Tax=Kineococcus xinjiangensis TaxID=512762 RepID=A0A2S6IX90_9ACTN|nr:MFS transporter [Kineococcus xinjiangensis]PPK98850.1 inositol transporter-like SP family MFS transporter [Kineococcus xinjiangensis]
MNSSAAPSAPASGPAPVSPRRAWYIAVVAGMASYLDAGAIAGSATALALYKEEFGFSGAQYSQLAALLTAMIAVGALIGGRLGDRYGRKRVFGLTMVLFALGAALLTFAPGVAFLYAGVAVLGFAAGADLPPSLAMVAESAPVGKKGKMIAFSHVLWMVGVVVVIFLQIGVGAMGVTGARIIFGHLLVVSLIVLVLRFGLPESLEWSAARSGATAEVQHDAIDFTSLKGLFRSRYAAPLVATGLFYALANIAANTNGQFQTVLYTQFAGLDFPTAGMYSLIGLVFVFVGMFTLMRLVDTRYRRPAFIVGAVLAVTAWIVPAVGGISVATLLTMSVLFALGGAIAGEPMYKVWSQELLPTLYRSTAQGITIAFARIVAAVVALVTYPILEVGPNALFGFLAVTTLAACLIGLLWISRMPKAESATGPALTPAPKAAQPSRAL